ncbi:acyl carrier protein [Arenicella chitinivorans]|uniref:Acyl carrier protein n=1 Tax=Arenicella chitinivorans TaxID=1329800 RepID=A0A918RVZ4_9GAMM|nr:acyl carrier protein [Arenicella chitinivorans]GHA14675.1 acyl carrier protein [Arenicella chitinivorans]
MPHSKQEVLDHINGVLIELFEIDKEKLVPEARLYDDLDIDSIDTIDLLIELKKFVGKDIDADAFIDARTIDEVAEIIHKM